MAPAAAVYPRFDIAEVMLAFLAAEKGGSETCALRYRKLPVKFLQRAGRAARSRGPAAGLSNRND
jgi:hypothetical protein